MHSHSGHIVNIAKNRTKMRKRKIRKIGNSYYVKLEQVDVVDWESKEGDLVEVKPIGDKKDD